MLPNESECDRETSVVVLYCVASVTAMFAR
jgi:hypothetical protein